MPSLPRNIHQCLYLHQKAYRCIHTAAGTQCLRLDKITHLRAEEFAVIRDEPHRTVQPVTADVYAHLSVFDDFARLTDPALYTPLPSRSCLSFEPTNPPFAAAPARCCCGRHLRWPSPPSRSRSSGR